MNNDALCLENLVNKVDYNYMNTVYEPSIPALSYINFIKLVNGSTGEENKSPVIHMDMVDNANEYDNNLFIAARGTAKALALTESILTPTGSKSIRDIVVGDTVYDREGKPTKVILESEVFHKPMYRIMLEDGRELDVSGDHLNIVRKRTHQGFTEEVLTTEEIIRKKVHTNRKVCWRNPTGKETKWYIPLNGCVKYSTKDTLLDPYTVGVLLGDGNIGSDGYSRVHTHIDDLDELRAYIPYTTSTVRKDKRNPNTVRFSLRGVSKQVKAFVGTANTYTKRIPLELLTGSVKQRKEVLRGLMDTDGTVTTKGRDTSFSSVSWHLAEGVTHLVRSLGGRAKCVKNMWDGYSSYRVHLLTDFNPFKLSRKANLWQPCTTNKLVHVGIVDIIPIPEVPSKCIGVASSTHSFLTESCVVTHNTTALHEYMILYLATYGEFFDFGKVNVGMYISDTIDNGVKSMRKNLQFRYDNSEFLQKYVPFARFTDVRWEFRNVDGHMLCFRGFGASTGVRGFKEYGERPTWLGMDDLMSDKNSTSPTIINDMNNIIYKAARQAMHPDKRKIIWTGTPFNQKDPLYQAAKSKSWNTTVYPICEKYPCAKKDFQGAWDDRFPWEFVKAEYDLLLEAGQINAFNQELMLRIMSEEERMIQDTDIQWYSRGDLVRRKSSYNFYITTDFANTEAESADYSVISVWAINHKGMWFWVDGICKRQLMNKNIDSLFHLAQKWKPQEVGVEVSGQQEGFISIIQAEMIKRNIFFNFASDNNSNRPGIRPVNKSNKMSRFNLVLPWFKAKYMFFPEELKGSVPMIECMEELELAAVGGFKSKHDDFIDSISMLGVMVVFRPSDDSVGMTKNDSDDIWEDEDLDDDVLGMQSYIV